MTRPEPPLSAEGPPPPPAGHQSPPGDQPPAELWTSAHGWMPPEVPAGQQGRHRRPGRLRELGFTAGPVAVAAAATAVLVLFGLGAVLVPVLFDNDEGPSRPPAEAGAGTVDSEPTPEPTTAPSPTPAPPSPTKAAARTPTSRPSASGRPAYEDKVAELVNAERAKARIPCRPVRHDSKLRTAARAHSNDMALNNYFSHDGRDGSSPSERAERAGYDGSVSENIAMGQQTPEDVMRSWMNSSGHRANILNCRATSIGVGLAYRGRTPYWTQNFGRD